MRRVLIPIIAALAVACGGGGGTKVAQNPLLDSLRIDKSLGEVLQRRYVGELPAADCPGIIYDLTIFNQEHSGDGVYSLKMTYLEAENGKDMTFDQTGRLYTERGIPSDPDATVYTLVSFGSGEYPTRFLYMTDSLEMLNGDREVNHTGLNYTIRLQR